MNTVISCFILICFTLTGVVGPYQVQAQEVLRLPAPGVMVNLSPAYESVLIKGLKIHPENPFLFDFIIDPGNTSLQANDVQLKEESSKLIKYFLASLTIPEKDLWVNLSPYEKDRMIAPNLGQTEMGRDMLAQDYILKQLTASLIYPEKNLGKEFWDRVYAKSQQIYGTTQIPVNTFNKVWIVADRADVFERGNVAYVVGAHLKVMLEEDYLALSKHQSQQAENSIASKIVKEIVLPDIEHEVNTGKNFVPLRQMFYSMVLASWYKTALKNAILTQIYGNKSKVKVGINQDDPKSNKAIFNRYLQAYKKGVFNYIKEDIDQATKEPIPRKYFSGGALVWGKLNHANIVTSIPKGTSFSDRDVLATVNLFPQRAVKSAAMIVRLKEASDQLNEENSTYLQKIINNGRNKLVVRFYEGRTTIDYSRLNLSKKGMPPHARILAEVIIERKLAEDEANGLIEELEAVLRNQEEILPKEFLTIVEQASRAMLTGKNIKTTAFVALFLALAAYQITKRGDMVIGQNITLLTSSMAEKVDVAKSTTSPEVLEALARWALGKENSSNPFDDTKKIEIMKGINQLTEIAYIDKLDRAFGERQTELSGLPFVFIHIILNPQTSSDTISEIKHGLGEKWGLLLGESLINPLYPPFRSAMSNANYPVSEALAEAFKINTVNYRFKGELDDLENSIGAFEPNFDEKNMPTNEVFRVLATSPKLSPKDKEELRKIHDPEIDRVLNKTNTVPMPVNSIRSTNIVPAHTISALPAPRTFSTAFDHNGNPTNGGIDLNAKNMGLNVTKEGKGIEMKFDSAMIERIKREGFDGLEFKIQSIVPVANLPLILGVSLDKN